MAKENTTALSARELLTKRNATSTRRKIKDGDIDYSDIPRLTDAQLGKFKRRGRPVLGDTRRMAISIRIEEHLLLKIKKKAKSMKIGYQSLINEILKKAV